MAALTPVASVEALLGAIQKSGLLSVEAMAKVRDDAGRLNDPKQLARELIKSRTLTKWQAEQLLHGYHRLLVGKYKLLDQLATAPTGRIYLAEHVQMGRRHLLKVLAKRLAGDPEAVKQFLDAARRACALDHRNISHVYDVNQDRLGHYVVMEYVEGEDLERLVEPDGRLKFLEALDFIAQAAEGLAHAHSSGVVHGDLKPANLLRDQSGTIKILEIGQTGPGATLQSEDADDAVAMAALAAVIFQAPELRGEDNVADVACDVYSLGSVFSFLLTGKAAADAAAAALQLQAAGDIPEAAIDLCRHLMAENPKERPGSMQQVLGKLAEIARASISPPAVKADGSDISRPKEKPEKSETASVKPDQTPQKAEKKETPTGKPEQPPTKWKQPPVAKALSDDDKQPVVIFGDVSPAETEPIDSFKIKTRGRRGKKPPVQPPAPAANADAVSTSDAAPAKTVFTPLVLAGAIGGGGALVLGLIIALVCLFAVSRRPDKSTASRDKAAEIGTVAKAPTATAAESESNPEAPAVEKNPETNPAINSTATPAAAATSPPAAETKPAESPAPVKADLSATVPAETKKDSPPEPKKEPEPKPEPKPAPQPPPARPAPKPAAKPAPFQGFSKAVSLPELPETAAQPAPDGLSPAPLGPSVLDEKAALSVNLLSNDSPVRGSRQKFELAPKAGDNRQWDVLLGGGGMTTTIATLNVKDGKLNFQWTEDALKQAPVARHLSNCALELTADKSRHVVALRTAVQGPPLVVDIEKQGVGVKWNIADLPIAKQLQIEITSTEGFKRLKQEPKDAVSAGEQITVWTGPSDKSIPLGLKLATTANARGVEIKLQPQVKLEGEEPRPYRRKEFLSLQQQAAEELPLLEAELKRAKDSRSSQQNPVRAMLEKKAREQRLTTLTADLLQRSTQLDQVKYLTDFNSSMAGGAKIHFRVFTNAGPVQIDLLRTEEEPPPDKPK